MLKEIFEFGDDKVKLKIIYDDKLTKKIMHCMTYLEKHLPVNKLKKDNSFNFNQIKFDQGKNYDWFFLTNNKVSILIRKYSTHFTFFTITKSEQSYFNKLSVFTMIDNFDKMDTDELNDSYCDNNFLTLEKVLPKLVEMIEKNKVGSLWNDHSFERPKFTEIKIAFIGEESVHSLDLLIFASDEIFQMFLVYYSQNETLKKLSELKVGDSFGKYYTIASVKTEVKDGYFHGVGVSKYRNGDETKKEEWSDVYSLTRYYYDELFYGNLKEEINDFLFLNHEKVFDSIFPKIEIKFILQFTNLYSKEMYKLFVADGKDIDIKIFTSFIPKKYIDFIEYYYLIKLKNLVK